MSNNAGDKLKESPHKPGGAQEQQQAAAGDPNKKLVDLGLLEEDDEFEEFPEDEWVKNQKDKIKIFAFSLFSKEYSFNFPLSLIIVA